MNSLKASACPLCRAMLDAATGIDSDSVPVQGDVTVCLYCGTLLQFGRDMELQPAANEALAKIGEAARQQLLLIQSKIRRKVCVWVQGCN